MHCQVGIAVSHINEGKLQEALEILDYIIGSATGPQNTGAYIARGTARAILRDLEGACSLCALTVAFVDLPDLSWSSICSSQSAARSRGLHLPSSRLCMLVCSPSHANASKQFCGRGCAGHDNVDLPGWSGRGCRTEACSLAGAVQDFSVTIREMPTYGDAWMRRGQARAAMGEEEAAMHDFEQCARLTADPGPKVTPSSTGLLRAADPLCPCGDGT